MEKIKTMVYAVLQLFAAADSISPVTGERANILPYIIGIVAIVLIVALLWLSYISKNNTK